MFKRFAYSTAFDAVADLFADNLLETKKPENMTCTDPIDTSYHAWNGRVRFPVPESYRKPQTIQSGQTICGSRTLKTP